MADANDAPDARLAPLAELLGEFCVDAGEDSSPARLEKFSKRLLFAFDCHVEDGMGIEKALRQSVRCIGLVGPFYHGEVE